MPVAAETMALSSAIAADAGAARAPAFVLRPDDAAALGRIASACDEPLYALAKRTLDLVCAAVLLVALLPVFALVGLAIVLESRGPTQSGYWATAYGTSGRGPTRLISPRSTFHSCGSSSRLVRRRNAPTRVIRGSSGTL